MQENQVLHFNKFYLLFIILVGVVIIGGLYFDFEDEGDCARTLDNELKMRKPGSTGWVSTEYCIFINR